jgi:hypothetical protein
MTTARKESRTVVLPGIGSRSESHRAASACGADSGPTKGIDLEQTRCEGAMRPGAPFQSPFHLHFLRAAHRARPPPRLSWLKPRSAVACTPPGRLCRVSRTSGGARREFRMNLTLARTARRAVCRLSPAEPLAWNSRGGDSRIVIQSVSIPSHQVRQRA